MNVIWIVADTFRQDHLGAYGNPYIRTPSLDALAARSVRFDWHYAAGFPTMPTRADHATGRWTMSFMGWEPLSGDVEILARSGFHTAASVDTPFYLRGGMNYDRGFQTFFAYPGQSLADVELLPRGREARDARAAWRFESDRNVAQTVTRAMRWLELHCREDFFLYIDTWDPHEPWDAPAYYTELYLPGYDGEVVRPTYGYWRDEPGYTEERVATAHATYCGEVTMVDTWVGYLLRLVENMGLMENTAIIFTSDHGFYFGEHGGLFGKMTLARQADGTLYEGGDRWDFCPLYEEVAKIPLLIYAPGVAPATYGGVTSVVDVMPTVLEMTGQEKPALVEGTSLLSRMWDPAAPGRDFTVTTIPFANVSDPVSSVDDFRRWLMRAPATTITVRDWSLIYSPEEGLSELYHLPSDPSQERNVIATQPAVAADVHRRLVEFMRATKVPEHLVAPRLELRI